MNCTATLLRATQAGKAASASAASGLSPAKNGVGGATPTKPFSTVLEEDARLPAQTATPGARQAPAAPNPNAKANATSKSGAAKAAQDSNASGLSSRNPTGKPATDPTAQAPQGATSIPVPGDKSGSAPSAPPQANEVSGGKALPTSGANAPAAAQAVSVSPPPPAALDSTNAAAAGATAPAGNAAPRTESGAEVLSSAQDTQPAGARSATAQSPADSSAEAGKPADKAAAGPVNADSSASGNLASVATSSEQPAGTEVLVPTADPRQIQAPTARAEKGVGTATDVAQADPLQSAGESRPTTDGPDFSLSANSSVPQPAPGSAPAPASAAAPTPASVEEVIARLLAPKPALHSYAATADAGEPGASHGTQPATSADQGQTAARSGDPAQTPSSGPVGAVATGAQTQPTTKDPDAGVRENGGAADPAAGENSATGAEEDVSHAISSPSNDATAARDSHWPELAQGQSSDERTSARTGVKSATETAESSFLTAAPAMERAASDSSAKPANASSGLDETHFLGNVVRQASLLTRPDGASELTLSLQPPEMGTVVVRLTLKDDRLQGQLQVDSQSVREHMESLIPAVKQSLAGEGIDLDRLNVGVRGQGAEAAGPATQDGGGGRQASQTPTFSPRDGDARSESGTREEAGVSAVGSPSRRGGTSAWVGVMDFVA